MSRVLQGFGDFILSLPAALRTFTSHCFPGSLLCIYFIAQLMSTPVLLLMPFLIRWPGSEWLLPLSCSLHTAARLPPASAGTGAVLLEHSPAQSLTCCPGLPLCYQGKVKGWQRRPLPAKSVCWPFTGKVCPDKHVIQAGITNNLVSIRFMGPGTPSFAHH